MPSVYIEENKKRKRITLSFGEYASIIYHDMFDYPLSFDEVSKWSISEEYLFSITNGVATVKKVDYESGYFYSGEDKHKIHKRMLRKKSSEKKLHLAYKAANLLSFIPSILFVGITGSLAMDNADENADIDLLIITTKNTLWFSRVLALLLLTIFGLKVRRKAESEQKDKICANVWLTENSMEWDVKNIFTAHEIAQIKPLFNKNSTFEKFLSKNKWVYSIFPNINNHKLESSENIEQASSTFQNLIGYINKLLFKIQYRYMKKSITNEVVVLDKALFHPVSLSNYVENRFRQIYMSN